MAVISTRWSVGGLRLGISVAMRPKRGPGEKDRWEGGTAGGSFVGGTKQLITEYGGPSGPQPILSPLA